MLSSDLNMFCPACNAHEWDASTRGTRTCPQCGALCVCTKTGVRVKRATPGRPRRDGKSQSERGRLYRVVQPDGLVLCIACAKPTNLLEGIDGKTDKLRGVFCPACCAALPVRPVGLKADKRPLTVRAFNFNTKRQRAEAEEGEIAIWLARRNGAECATEATAREGANWLHTGDSSWLTGRMHFGVKVNGQGDARVVRLRSAHPPMCGCTGCLHSERVETFDPIAHIDRAIYRGPAAVAQWTGRLQLTRLARPGTDYVVRSQGSAAPVALEHAPRLVKRRRPVYSERGRRMLRLVTEVTRCPSCGKVQGAAK